MRRSATGATHAPPTALARVRIVSSYLLFKIGNSVVLSVMHVVKLPVIFTGALVGCRYLTFRDTRLRKGHSDRNDAKDRSGLLKMALFGTA